MLSGRDFGSFFLIFIFSLRLILGEGFGGVGFGLDPARTWAAWIKSPTLLPVADSGPWMSPFGFLFAR